MCLYAYIYTILLVMLMHNMSYVLFENNVSNEKLA